MRLSLPVSQSPAANSLECSADNLSAVGVDWGCYAALSTADSLLFDNE